MSLNVLDAKKFAKHFLTGVAVNVVVVFGFVLMAGVDYGRACLFATVCVKPVLAGEPRLLRLRGDHVEDQGGRVVECV